jgi:integrase
MPRKTVPKREKIGRRLYEVTNSDGTVSYFADTEIDGTQRRIKLDARGRTEAREAQANLSSDQSRGKLAAPTRITVAEVAAEWLATLNDAKPRTLAAYEERVRKSINPYFGSRQIQSVRPKDCTAFVRWLASERKLSPRTQTAVLSALNGILEHALLEEYISINPLSAAKRNRKKLVPKTKQEPHKYLSPVEIERLLEHSNGYRTLFEVLVFSGLRYSEAAGLIWSDIDLTAGTISVTAQLARHEPERVSTKNEQERVVNIDPVLVGLLREHKTKALSLGRAGADQFVFQTENGTVLNYQNVWAAFQLAAERAGLNEDGRPLRIHDLRRSYASVLLTAGAPATYVAKQLGHTVAVLFQTYAGLIENVEGQHREQQLAAVAAFRSGAHRPVS